MERCPFDVDRLTKKQEAAALFEPLAA